jgi:hypothetical protein
VDRPFPDLAVPDLLDAPGDYETEAVEVVGLCEESETEDRLSPARGILFALILVTPFWMAVYWLLS